ncbi:MAG: SAM-dependent methyltransferase [Clostridia bacterium]|nr:SAM-dependent methyltransferase [Clostridia bacterium]
MEQIRLNDRLLTAMPFVRKGKRFADIGTDHAYLPIYLITEGIISNAIAADINKGPLDKADENITKYGLNTQISTVLCDGLAKITPDEVDDVAIFGMGGELIIKIIDEASWLKDADKRLILQPMTHPEKLRKYLAQNGYKILGETLSLDRGKIYQTISVEYDGFAREYSDFIYAFGEYILKEKSQLLLQLLDITKNKLERKINGKRAGGEDISYEMNLLESINNYIER